MDVRDAAQHMREENVWLPPHVATSETEQDWTAGCHVSLTNAIRVWKLFRIILEYSNFLKNILFVDRND